jgi:hypothetical protein
MAWSTSMGSEEREKKGRGKAKEMGNNQVGVQHDHTVPNRKQKMNE